MRTKGTIVAVLALVLGVAAPASARRCGGVTVPDSVQVGGTQLSINGTGIREATALNINVYVAALYVETPSTEATSILGTDQRRRIDLHFVRNVDRSDIVSAFESGFRNNSGGSYGALQPRIEQLLGWVSRMREGDTLSFTYVPGEGTTFSVNGRVMGTITGEDFGRAVFALFVGPRPPNRGLRNGLLGGRCG